MHLYLLLIILALTPKAMYAQAEPKLTFDINKQFPVTQLRQDLRILRDSLEHVHPALYRYTSRQSLDSLFQAAYQRIHQPMLLKEFYGLVAPLVSTVGDIHTVIELPDAYHTYLATQSELFPFDVRILNQKVFIASNNSQDSSIPVGSKITKINNQPISDILARMGSYFSSEGTNQTFKIKRAEQRFAFHYQFVYGYYKQFSIQYLDDNKKLQTRTVAALPFQVIRENRARNQSTYPHLKPLFVQPPYLTLAVNQEKQTAILTIKWFQNDVLQSSGQQFKPFIDSAFAAIKKTNTQNLIIDIRGNEGGESGNAAYLYSYLTNKPFRFLYAIEAAPQIYAQDKKHGVNYVLAQDTGNYRTTDTTVKLPQFFGLDSQQPQANAFTGKLFVLINGLTSSAAPQFASLVKLHKRGKLIGEEAPGALYGGSGREYTRFSLPHTGLLVTISHYRQYLKNPSGKLIDKCVAPDYTPPTSMQDLLKGLDKDMEAALIMIDSGS